MHLQGLSQVNFIRTNGQMGLCKANGAGCGKELASTPNTACASGKKQPGNQTPQPLEGTEAAPG